jgi:3-dehydroquinate synthase
MKHIRYKFSNAVSDYYFSAGFSFLSKITDIKNSVFLTDDNIFNAHTKKFRNRNVIVLKPGEEFKVQQTVDSII